MFYLEVMKEKKRKVFQKKHGFLKRRELSIDISVGTWVKLQNGETCPSLVEVF